MLEPPPNSPAHNSHNTASGEPPRAAMTQGNSDGFGKSTTKPAAFRADALADINQPEDSILFRVLVQVLVFVSIGTVDIVASTSNSLWAIPLSAAGAAWGWYARRRRNILVKALIALAMIAMLMIFLTDLVTQSEETRLLLARLLIQLQVLHSFDLPRRKDLGYSIVIGIILMGMSASLSQTMIFAVLLVLFLALSLPVMVLDHRSRLQLPTQGFQLERLGIRPLPLLGFLGAVLALGLTIFALLPRLPGYQLRNFPISTGLAVRREIPRGGIISRQQNGPGAGNNQNPGQQVGEIGTGGGQGGGQQIEEVLPPLFAPEIDASQMAPRPRKPELVMRVRSQAELFWRVMAYDEFTGKGWRVSRNNKDQIRTIRRSFWNYEFFLPYFAEQLIDPRNTQEVIQTYTLTTENFPNLVPAAATPYRLFFPSEEVDYDLEGTIRGPGPLPNNLTYTVISAVSKRDRSGLIKTSQKYPRLLQRYYLNVPSQATADKLSNLARSWIDNAKNPASGKALNLDNPYDVSLFLAQELKQRYTIQNWTLNQGQTSVVDKFLEQKGGQEGQFVSTLVLMLRSLGIPTRYVVGFASGKFNPFTGFYEVYNTDAMSLAEVFFPGYGWMTFDPVPTRPLFPVSIEEDRTFSVLQTFWQWIASFLPAPLVGFVAAMFSNLGKALMALLTWLNELGAAGIILSIVSLFGIALGGWLLWQLWRSWREYRRLQRMHPVQRVYTQMLQRLQEEGLTKAPYYTPFEYLQWLEEQLEPSTALDKIRHITGVYQSWRYGAQENFDLTALNRMLKSIRRLPKRAMETVPYPPNGFIGQDTTDQSPTIDTVAKSRNSR